ncbi:unnamed protein product [Amoebophrya sp. A25]|nr:unnamed protein product [Amoebophrya sp. A25]|eukprot:GSA25T00004854001.1
MPPRNLHACAEEGLAIRGKNIAEAEARHLRGVGNSFVMLETEHQRDVQKEEREKESQTLTTAWNVVNNYGPCTSSSTLSKLSASAAPFVPPGGASTLFEPPQGPSLDSLQKPLVVPAPPLQHVGGPGPPGANFGPSLSSSSRHRNAEDAERIATSFLKNDEEGGLLRAFAVDGRVSDDRFKLLVDQSVPRRTGLLFDDVLAQVILQTLQWKEKQFDLKMSKREAKLAAAQGLSPRDSGIRFLNVFRMDKVGSVVRGTDTPGSDVDFRLYYEITAKNITGGDVLDKIKRMVPQVLYRNKTISSVVEMWWKGNACLRVVYPKAKRGHAHAGSCSRVKSLVYDIWFLHGKINGADNHFSSGGGALISTRKSLSLGVAGAEGGGGTGTGSGPSNSGPSLLRASTTSSSSPSGGGASGGASLGGVRLLGLSSSCVATSDHDSSSSLSHISRASTSFSLIQQVQQPAPAATGVQLDTAQYNGVGSFPSLIAKSRKAGSSLDVLEDGLYGFWEAQPQYRAVVRLLKDQFQRFVDSPCRETASKRGLPGIYLEIIVWVIATQEMRVKNVRRRYLAGAFGRPILVQASPTVNGGPHAHGGAHNHGSNSSTSSTYLHSSSTICSPDDGPPSLNASGFLTASGAASPSPGSEHQQFAKMTRKEKKAAKARKGSTSSVASLLAAATNGAICAGPPVALPSSVALHQPPSAAASSGSLLHLADNASGAANSDEPLAPFSLEEALRCVSMSSLVVATHGEQILQSQVTPVGGKKTKGSVDRVLSLVEQVKRLDAAARMNEKQKVAVVLDEIQKQTTWGPPKAAGEEQAWHLLTKNFHSEGLDVLPDERDRFSLLFDECKTSSTNPFVGGATASADGVGENAERGGKEEDNQTSSSSTSGTGESTTRLKQDNNSHSVGGVVAGSSSSSSSTANKKTAKTATSKGSSCSASNMTKSKASSQDNQNNTNPGARLVDNSKETSKKKADESVSRDKTAEIIDTDLPSAYRVYLLAVLLLGTGLSVSEDFSPGSGETNYIFDPSLTPLGVVIASFFDTNLGKSPDFEPLEGGPWALSYPVASIFRDASENLRAFTGAPNNDPRLRLGALARAPALRFWREEMCGPLLEELSGADCIYLLYERFGVLSPYVVGRIENEVESLFRTVLDFFFDKSCIVKIFGSVENGTATRGSDVDCGLILSPKIFAKYAARVGEHSDQHDAALARLVKKEVLSDLTKFIQTIDGAGEKKSMDLELVLEARVPIVKCHVQQQIRNTLPCMLEHGISSFDISVLVEGEFFVLQNSALVRSVLLADERYRMLAVLVKRYAKQMGIRSAWEGTLSSYSYALLVLHFIHMREKRLQTTVQHDQESSQKLTMSEEVVDENNKIENNSGGKAGEPHRGGELQVKVVDQEGDPPKQQEKKVKDYMQAVVGGRDVVCTLPKTTLSVQPKSTSSKPSISTSKMTLLPTTTNNNNAVTCAATSRTTVELALQQKSGSLEDVYEMKQNASLPPPLPPIFPIVSADENDNKRRPPGCGSTACPATTSDNVPEKISVLSRPPSMAPPSQPPPKHFAKNGRLSINSETSDCSFQMKFIEQELPSIKKNYQDGEDTTPVDSLFLEFLNYYLSLEYQNKIICVNGLRDRRVEDGSRFQFCIEDPFEPALLENAHGPKRVLGMLDRFDGRFTPGHQRFMAALSHAKTVLEDNMTCSAKRTNKTSAATSGKMSNEKGVNGTPTSSSTQRSASSFSTTDTSESVVHQSRWGNCAVFLLF